MTRAFTLHRAHPSGLPRTLTDDYWVAMPRRRDSGACLRRYWFCAKDFERLTGLRLTPGQAVRVRLTRTRRTP